MMFLGFFGYGVDVDEATATGLAIFHAPGDFCEEGVVFAASDVCAGMKFGAALAHEDAATGYDLAAVSFGAEALCVTVATVT